MSIQEALKRNVSPPQQRGWEEQNEWSRNLRRERYEYSFSFLRKSGSLKLLRELAHIIRTDFPDVALIRHIYPVTGEVDLALEWNYEKPKDTNSGLRDCNRLSVHADPLSGFIVVEGNNLFTTLSESEWSSSQVHLENAIVHAYRQPTRGFSDLGWNRNIKTIPIDPTL